MPSSGPLSPQAARVRPATLARRATMSGVGLHSGKPVKLEVEPALPGTGLRFVRIDLPGEPEIPATVAAIRSSSFCTTLGDSAGAEVATVEHLLAALRGLGVTDAVLRVEGPEVPVGDGSAACFADLLAEAGLAAQGGEAPYLELDHPVGVSRGEAVLVALPAEEPQFTYVFTHPHPAVGVQLAEFVPDRDDFRTALAPARTIGFLADIERMREQGLALGGSLECAVVIGDEGYVGPLRFPNEPARHKLLDLMGDLALIPPVRAHVLGLRSGHALNAELAREILRAGRLRQGGASQWR
ncbi:MAG TPA: UDP-3-O-[3-hydroxymyristoyl] N-acetylglucosamine deacetylase [Firmicutes bacterium]|nr:UDP-3-O-[3-hydroxymyristoyl] N-acetylglucosamine deacetylase [Bacillota bacterium]